MSELISTAELSAAGERMMAQARRLFPICRSITGDGLRQTLQIIGEDIALDIREVPTGSAVFDWQVPREWNIRTAWLRDPSGRIVVDFADSNLHVVNYSAPVHLTMPLAQLRPRLHSLPDRPDWIPYRTAYYAEDWGLCLSHRQLQALPDGDYEVCIDSTLTAGSLSYGECWLPGSSQDEVLVSCHVCHPSLANDNLAGIAVATELARRVAAMPRRRLGYRFVMVPATIGAITWLAANESVLPNIRHGFVLSCAGDPGPITYKRSLDGDAAVDRAFSHVLQASGAAHRIEDFVPYGYDERQYNSPGIRLPVGCLMRTPNGRYPQYHTSADNLEFIEGAAMADTLHTALQVIDVLEHNQRYLNLCPRGEPQLGRRGLYQALAQQKQPADAQMALLWVLNQSDGHRDLLQIANRSGLPFDRIRDAALLLVQHELLQCCAPPAAAAG